MSNKSMKNITSILTYTELVFIDLLCPDYLSKWDFVPQTDAQTLVA